MAIGAVLFIAYKPSDVSHISLFALLGLALLILPPLVYLIVYFKNYENRIKIRLVNRAEKIASCLNMEITNLPEDFIKQPLHNFKFSFRQKMGPTNYLYIQQQELKINKKVNGNNLYRSFHRFSISTTQTEWGIFICSNRNQMKYNWEEQGYTLHKNTTLLDEKFTVYTRNPNQQLLKTLSNSSFIQLLIDNEHCLLKPITFNFDKYHFEAFIQRFPNPKPQYGLLQFEKTIEEETTYEIQELEQQIAFLKSFLNHLNYHYAY